jgi:hypothetical protein
MKVAIVHDYIKEYGGAEGSRGLRRFLMFRFIHAFIFQNMGHRERFKTWNIKTSWADAIPFNSKLIVLLEL